MTGALEFRVRAQLRWRDIDQLGHLNQSVYPELLEEGRAGLMMELISRTATGGAAPGTHGFYVLAHVDLDYRREVRKSDGEVDIVVWVASVGGSSFRLDHEVRLLDGTVAASGSTVMVGWDPAARSKRALSTAERTALLG